MGAGARPPRISRKILGAVLHAQDRTYALSDLAEEFEARCVSDGLLRARWWYRKQVMMSLVPAFLGRFVRRPSSDHTIVGAPWSETLLSNLFSDVRLSLRTLIKTPLVLIVTVLSLGVGVGVTTVAFALVNDLLVRPPMGFDEPKGLVTIYRSQSNGRRYGGASMPDFVDVVEQLDALESVTAITELTVAMDGPISPVALFAEGVSLTYFDVTGVRPVVGRVFTPSDAEGLAAPRVAVLGYDIWMSAFSGNPEVVGMSVRINARPFTIIGVAPDGVNSRRIPLETDVWLPLGSLQENGLIPDEQRLDRNVAGVGLFARLSPGQTVESVQVQADVLASRLHAEFPDEWADETGAGRSFTVLSEADSRLNPRAKALFAALGLFIVGSASLILLLACANVAGLFAARARRRRTELAVRVSLGASRARIVRMMVVEGLLPGLMSGALGVAITLGVTRLIGAYTLPVQLPVRLDAELTPTVLLFAFGMSVLGSLGFSLLPALGASKPHVLSALKEAGGAGAGSRGRLLSMKNGLVIAQCATSAILLVGATLFIRTLDLATTMNLGFDPDRIAVATKRLDPDVVGAREGAQYVRDLRASLAQEAGVEGVAMSRLLELTLFQPGMQVAVAVDGFDPGEGAPPEAFRNSVTPGYLELLQIPLLRGRSLEEADTEDSRLVAVVNETFASRYWPSGDALGRTFTMGLEDQRRLFSVVGVARNGKYQDFDDPATAYFWTSLYQDYTPQFAVAVKGTDSAESMLGLLRSEIELAEGEIQLVAPTALDAQVSIQFIHLRIASRLLGWGGLFGLFLAAIGIYGVVSFAVTQRSREMAIRIALGAERAHVVRSVAFDGLRLAALGLAVGIAIVLPLASLARGVLYGVSPSDPLAVGVGVGVLALVAVSASLIPACRVTRLDPMGTLRTE